jgi:hypothetical protein
MPTSTGRYAVGFVISKLSIRLNTRESRRAASQSVPTYWAPINC